MATNFDRFMDRVTRVTPVGAVLVLGFGLIPVLNLVSGALLALVVLLRGYFKAAVVGIAAVVGLAAIGWALGHGPFGMLIDPLSGPFLATWVPVFVLAAILRSSRSLALVVVVAALAASLVAVGQLVLISEPLLFWQHILAQALEPIKTFREFGNVQWHKAIVSMARLMPGVSAAGLLFAALIMVFAGRYGQARLLRPGAFGAEFRCLSLGRTVTVAASLVLVARLIHPGLVLENLAVVMLAMFAVQGLAVMHALFRAYAWPRWALVLIYVLICLFPLWLLGLVSGAGLVDNWFDFRRLRVQPPAS